MKYFRHFLWLSEGNAGKFLVDRNLLIGERRYVEWEKVKSTFSVYGNPADAIWGNTHMVNI